MRLPWKIKIALITMLATLMISVSSLPLAHASTQGAAKSSKTSSPMSTEAGGGEDFRGRVMFAYGTVFAVLVAYLLLSYRRNSSLKEEVLFLEKRIAELETGEK